MSPLRRRPPLASVDLTADVQSARCAAEEFPPHSSRARIPPRARTPRVMTAPPAFKTLIVGVNAATHVGTLALNRPSKSNAIDGDMWREVPEAMRWLDENEHVRCVLLTGEGKNFCAGSAVSTPESLSSQLGQSNAMKGACAGRKAEALYRCARRGSRSSENDRSTLVATG